MLEVLAGFGLRPPVGKDSAEWCREAAEEIRQNWGLDAELLKFAREMTGCKFEDLSGFAAVQHIVTRLVAADREMAAKINPLRESLAAYGGIAAAVPDAFSLDGAEPRGPKSLEAMIRKWNDLLIRAEKLARGTDSGLATEIRYALGLES